MLLMESENKLKLHFKINNWHLGSVSHVTEDYLHSLEYIYRRLGNCAEVGHSRHGVRDRRFPTRN